MSKRKQSGKKAYRRLQERAGNLERLYNVAQTDVRVANDHLKIVIADWNTLCLFLYDYLGIQMSATKEGDMWVAMEKDGGQELARAPTMPEIFMRVFQLREWESEGWPLDESRPNG